MRSSTALGTALGALGAALGAPSVLALVLATGCGHGSPEGPSHAAGAPGDRAAPSVAATSAASISSGSPAPRHGRRTLTLIGTNDLHGELLGLPLFGGYVEAMRAARARDGGAVLLVDAGDMFQGTLESNLSEGRAVLRAYAALHYDAATIGNHEFDYGPVGPAATPESPADDPRGALKALAAAASFPMLAANLADRATGKRVDWPKVAASTVVVAAGVRVGLVGVTTEETLDATIRANVADLAVLPVAETIVAEAARLRAEQGAQVVVVLAHAGGHCKSPPVPSAPHDCDENGEIFRVARALPPGAVDAIVAGHSHTAIAREVNGVPIIESFSRGRAFGRVDLVVEGEPPRVVERRLFATRELCPDGGRACGPVAYDGATVTADPRITAAIAGDLAVVQAKRSESLGVHLTTPIRAIYDRESALGNLVADLMREAHPSAAIALVNGGGLRADLPEGVLTYGALYGVFPFDNRLATAKITGRDLVALLRAHFERTGGILSVSGARVVAACRGGQLDVRVEIGKKPLRDDAVIEILASDFMLTGGDAFWGPVKPPRTDFSAMLVRDALERGLRKRRALKDAEVLDPKHPRLVLPMARPVKCR